MKKLHIVFLVCLTGVNIVIATDKNNSDVYTEIIPFSKVEHTTIKEVETNKEVAVIVTESSSNNGSKGGGTNITDIKDTGNTETHTNNIGSANVTNSVTSKSSSNGSDVKPTSKFHEITKGSLSKGDGHTEVETNTEEPVIVTETSGNTGKVGGKNITDTGNTESIKETHTNNIVWQVGDTNITNIIDTGNKESVTETNNIDGGTNSKTTKDNSTKASIVEHVTTSKTSKIDSTMAPKASTVNTDVQTTVSGDSGGTRNEKPDGNANNDKDHVEVHAIDGGSHPQKSNENEKNYIPEADSPSSGHFMGYLLTAIILCVAGYVVFHNKQKIIAFIVEGRSGRQRRRTGNGVEYKKLHSNVEEVMPSLDQSAASKHFIY